MPNLQILDAIPPQLKGRGHPQCVPISCDCGALFLWEHRLGTHVSCPTCAGAQDFADADGVADPKFVAMNGQAR